jgi:hypothetical protein
MLVRVSGFRFQVSGFRFQVSGFGFRVLELIERKKGCSTLQPFFIDTFTSRQPEKFRRADT